jgi:hypothetical protein
MEELQGGFCSFKNLTLLLTLDQAKPMPTQTSSQE